MPEQELATPQTVPVCSYESQHLAFRKRDIEPLENGDVIEIATPAGTFRMTRGDLYADFPEVVESVSYRDEGEYHFPKIPYKAFRFLVREQRGGAAKSRTAA